MRTFVIQFLFSAVAGLVGTQIVAWLDQRYRRSGVSLASHAALRFPRVMMLRAGAMALVTAWVVILAAVLSLMIMTVVPGRSEITSIFVILLGLFFGCGALYTTVAVLVRCPQCDKRVFDQPSQPPYPDTFGGLTGFGATALRITVRREFRCAHCGQRFVVNSFRANEPV